MSPPVAAIIHEMMTMGVIFASNSRPPGPAENPPPAMTNIEEYLILVPHNFPNQQEEERRLVVMRNEFCSSERVFIKEGEGMEVVRDTNSIV